MKIYVSNLGFSVQPDDLRKIFSPHGVVASINIITDKFTNRSRGFAFVEMPDQQAGETAIRELDGSKLQDRSIKVNEARQEERTKKDMFR